MTLSSINNVTRSAKRRTVSLPCKKILVGLHLWDHILESNFGVKFLDQILRSNSGIKLWDQVFRSINGITFWDQIVGLNCGIKF